MSENITYVILCRRGLLKDECPFISQGNHCVECNYAYYVPRETSSAEKPDSKTEENNV